MPTITKTWSTCRDPEDKNWNMLQSAEAIFFSNISNMLEEPIETIIVFAIKAFIIGGVGGAGLLAVLADVMGKTLGLGCLAGAWMLGVLLYGLWSAIQSWDNMRLMCMESGACAIGTVVHHPHTNTNGDLDLDIAVAPFSPSVQREAIADEIKNATGVRPPHSIASYIALAAMKMYDRLAIYERAVDTHFLKSAPDKLFQAKYLRSTPLIDQFFLNKVLGLKPPIFRCPSDDRDEGEKVPIPSPITDEVLQNTFVYLPCVIEGHVIVEWLKNIRNGLLAGLIGFVAGCAVCMAFGLGPQVCALVGAAVGGFLAFLAWLLSHLSNNPSKTKADGGAAIPSTTTGNPGVGSSSTSVERGDVIVVYGSWVIFPYRNGFYEIHPVHAWYLICRGGSPFASPSYSKLSRRSCDTADMIQKDYDQICQMVHQTESSEPSPSLTKTFDAGLAMIGGLR